MGAAYGDSGGSLSLLYFSFDLSKDVPGHKVRLSYNVTWKQNSHNILGHKFFLKELNGGHATAHFSDGFPRIEQSPFSSLYSDFIDTDVPSVHRHWYSKRKKLV